MGSIRVKEQGERLRRVLWRRDRLIPSPRSEGNHEGAIGSQQRILDQRRARRESWRATKGSIRVKKQEEGLSRAGRDGNDSCRVLSQREAMGKPSRANGDTAMSQEAKRRLS